MKVSINTNLAKVPDFIMPSSEILGMMSQEVV
jgi:hypothetical protein